MVEGEVEVLEIDALPQERGDRFAARTGFDPRAAAAPYRWFRIVPRRIQAWREVNKTARRSAHGASPLRIHPIAWKGCSHKFASWVFSNVRQQSFDYHPRKATRNHAPAPAELTTVKTRKR
jgi:hypothetical protein